MAVPVIVFSGRRLYHKAVITTNTLGGGKYMELGKKIKQLRIKAGLTQEQLGQRKPKPESFAPMFFWNQVFFFFRFFITTSSTAARTTRAVPPAHRRMGAAEVFSFRAT